MMVSASLLPPNATPFERDIEAVIQPTRDIPVPISDVWNPQTCPSNLMPWLAWALSVDEWDQSWPDIQKREILSASVSVHRKKGTLGAIRDAIKAFGFGDATVVEGFTSSLHDGTATHDGSATHGTATHWAEYRIYLSRWITATQAVALRKVLDKIAPARCSLAQIIFIEAANIHNAAITHDGTFTHGAV